MANSMNTLETIAASVMVLKRTTWRRLKNLFIHMSRRIESPVILINHWRRLEANGYKKEASSSKLDKKELLCYRRIKEKEL